MCNKPTVGIVTLGCKVNQYESEAIAERFEAAGFLVSRVEADPLDVYVVNTCTVTAESDRKARQTIRRIHASAPNAKILVTGCLSQVNSAAVAALPGVAYVCGNDNKLSVVEAALSLLREGDEMPRTPQIAVNVIENAAFEPMCITKFDRTRAYVKIEDGCENRCTYCTIPAARGKVRSKPMSEVLAEVRGLVRGGCREIVLTGIETASYGRDLESTSLIDLLEATDAVLDGARLRLGSLDPSLMREAFVTRLANLTHLAPHFHLSIQSGSSAVLAAMKRKYNAAQALAGIRRLRAAIPRLELTADFIVGFPGETDADFEETLAFAREADFLQMHVFAYSPREGTSAAKLPLQLDGAVKRARSAALIALGAELRRGRLENALKSPRCLVLFETFENGVAIGHTDSFLEVAVKSPVPLHAQMRPVRLLFAEADRLIGELEEEYDESR